MTRPLSFTIAVALLMASGLNRTLTAQAPRHRRVDRVRGARRLGKPIHVARRIGSRERATHAHPHHHRTDGDVRRGERRARRRLPTVRVEARVGLRCVTGSRRDSCGVHRRPQRVPDEDCNHPECLRRVDCRPLREPFRDLQRHRRRRGRSALRCWRRAWAITAMIRSSKATRRAATQVCGSPLRQRSPLRRVRSSSSSRPSGTTTRRASAPKRRQRSAAGRTRGTTTRSKISVGPPTRAEHQRSRRPRCSGRHRRRALWTANIRGLAGSMDLLTAARFEALGMAAVANAVIACWDAKYTYMFWRPVTAITVRATSMATAGPNRIRRGFPLS